MNTGRIGEISGLRPVDGLEKKQKTNLPVGTEGGPSFGEALENALRTVDGGLQRADGSAEAYVAGENVDLHNVMMQLEHADLGFRTMVQVRNKLLEAYKEVMRIQV